MYVINTVAADVIVRNADDLVVDTGNILCMHPANERLRYIVTSSLIGWAHTLNDPCWYMSDLYKQITVTMIAIGNRNYFLKHVILYLGEGPVNNMCKYFQFARSSIKAHCVEHAWWHSIWLAFTLHAQKTAKFLNKLLKQSINQYIIGVANHPKQITSLTIVYWTVIQAQIKENIKAPRHWPLSGEFTDDQ